MFAGQNQQPPSRNAGSGREVAPSPLLGETEQKNKGLMMSFGENPAK
jgi:hypothetical protein